MDETKPKKVASRSVAIALGIICIVLVVAVVTSLSLRVSDLTQKSDKESTLLNIWANIWNNPDNLHTIPNNINDLFQNRVILWDSRNVTEPIGPFSGSPSFSNFTLAYNFTQYGCILVNITYSTVGIYGNWVIIKWSDGPQPHATYDNAVEQTNVGLFPVLSGTNSVQVLLGNFDGGNENVTATVSITYYY